MRQVTVLSVCLRTVKSPLAGRWCFNYALIGHGASLGDLPLFSIEHLIVQSMSEKEVSFLLDSDFMNLPFGLSECHLPHKRDFVGLSDARDSSVSTQVSLTSLQQRSPQLILD